METWKEDIRTCLDELSEEFTLEQVYGFIPKLQKLHASNKNIKAKIRQVLQQLRDNNEILFIEPGKYRRSKKEHGMAVTQLAQKQQDYEKQITMERIGSKILEEPVEVYAFKGD